MKIADTSQIKGIGAAPAERERPTAADRARAEDRVSTDETERVAAAVARASQAAGASRAARLQAIEAAVRQGTYRPDPQRIAQQILDDAEISARLQTLLGR